MTLQQSTFNSLSMDLFLAHLSSPPSSGDSVAVSTVALGTSNLLSNEVAVTVAHTLQQSLPTFVAAFHAENLTTPVSSIAPAPLFGIVFSLAVVAATFAPCFLPLQLC